MIFGLARIPAILDGSKTVTRRPAKKDHAGYLPCRYRPGRTYAVQPGRGKATVARIRVTDVRMEPLSGVYSPGEAQAEGFASVEEFCDYWLRLHGDMNAETVIYRIAFELVRDP